jgi:hypothetical protein
MTPTIASLLITAAAVWLSIAFALGLTTICMHYLIGYITRARYNGSDAHIVAPVSRRAIPFGAVAGRS